MLNKRFRIEKLIVICSLIFLLPMESALAAPEFRVGYVDLEKALSSSQAGIDAQKKYDVEVKSAQKELDGIKSDLKRKKETYEKQRDSLSVEARTGKEEELLNSEKQLKRKFQDLQEKLGRQNKVIVGELVKKLRVVVDEVGREQEFTLILERSDNAVLYADKSIDITDDVIKRFDRSVK